MKRLGITATAIMAAFFGVAGVAPVAHAAAPSSTVCTTLGSCVTVTMTGYNHFTFTITCKAGEVIRTGVRGYLTSGNWSTSTSRQVTCSAPGASPAPISRTYFGNTLVGHRAYLGASIPVKFGPYAGTAVPTGGSEMGPGVGFHWD